MTPDRNNKSECNSQIDCLKSPINLKFNSNQLLMDNTPKRINKKTKYLNIDEDEDILTSGKVKIEDLNSSNSSGSGLESTNG